jgi:SAM-dependent methyltransferase
VTLPPAYFDELYDADRDPWSLESRWYEQRKYALTVAGLPKPLYQRGLEVGCSVGVLTALLADRCSSLLAVDLADAAVAATRVRVADRAGVTVERRAMPTDWPEGSFDLVVLSEVGYYLSPDDLRVLVSQATASLESGGSLVAVHWRHDVADYPMRGDDVHAVIAEDSLLSRLVRHEEEDFLLEVYVRGPALSVARTTGVLT